MRLFMTTLFLLMLLTGCSPQDMNNLEERNGIAYIKGTKNVFDGSAISYYPDTGTEKKIYQEGSFRMGVKDGVWTTYKWNGDKESAQYRFGKLHGAVTLVNRDGRMIKEENYAHNLLNGVTTTWNYNGEVESQKEFKDGKQVQVVLNDDSNGKNDNRTSQPYWDDLKSGFKQGHF